MSGLGHSTGVGRSVRGVSAVMAVRWQAFKKNVCPLYFLIFILWFYIAFEVVEG